MSYYFAKTLTTGFDDAVRRTTEALKQEGFGIITEIDVEDTLNEKVNVDIRNYRILGACNPALAHEALQPCRLMAYAAAVRNGGRRADLREPQFQRIDMVSPAATQSCPQIRALGCGRNARAYADVASRQLPISIRAAACRRSRLNGRGWDCGACGS